MKHYIARNHVGCGRYITHGIFTVRAQAENTIMGGGSVVSTDDEATILSMREGNEIFRLGERVAVKKEFQRESDAGKVFTIAQLDENTLCAEIRDVVGNEETEDEYVQLRMLEHAF